METDYLKRKIDAELERWFQAKRRTPLLVTGVRQCGKTKSILHFAHGHYDYVNAINFWTQPSARTLFNGSLAVDELIRKITLQFPEFTFVPKKSVLFLDEIQDCPRARLALKSFKEDGRFDVVCSGSFLGLNVDESGSGEPKPNGAEDVLNMTTMDFEEYLWANGYREDAMDYLFGFLKRHEAIPEAIHEKLSSLFLEHMCVGGYPEVVTIFLETHRHADSFRKLQSLVFDIKGDPARRKDENGDPLYTSAEVMRIQSAFDLIPSFAISENKHYVLSRIKGGNGMQKKACVDYLCNAGVAFRVHNVTVPCIPLNASRIESDYKLFYGDISLLLASLGYQTIRGLLQDTLGPNKGNLFESAVADALHKAGVPLYCFRKSSGLEIDFVIEYQGSSALVEVKARNGNAKSAKTVLAHPEHYGKTRLIKIGSGNVSYENGILSMPHYLAFLLGRDTPLSAENGI